MAASKANDVQVYVASQSSGSSKQSVVKVAEITEQVVQEYLLALIEKLVAEGPTRYHLPCRTVFGQFWCSCLPYGNRFEASLRPPANEAVVLAAFNPETR
jgi:hypothetical protein